MEIILSDRNDAHGGRQLSRAKPRKADAPADLCRSANNMGGVQRGPIFHLP